MSLRFNPFDPFGLFERGSTPEVSQTAFFNYLHTTAIRKLGVAISDEADAVKMYTALADELAKWIASAPETEATKHYRSRLSYFQNQLAGIAVDEGRHHSTLELMKQEIQAMR